MKKIRREEKAKPKRGKIERKKSKESKRWKVMIWVAAKWWRFCSPVISSAFMNQVSDSLLFTHSKHTQNTLKIHSKHTQYTLKVHSNYTRYCVHCHLLFVFRNSLTSVVVSWSEKASKCSLISFPLDTCEKKKSSKSWDTSFPSGLKWVPRQEWPSMVKSVHTLIPSNPHHPIWNPWSTFTPSLYGVVTRISFSRRYESKNSIFGRIFVVFIWSTIRIDCILTEFDCISTEFECIQIRFNFISIQMNCIHDEILYYFLPQAQASCFVCQSHRRLYTCMECIFFGCYTQGHIQEHSNSKSHNLCKYSP